MTFRIEVRGSVRKSGKDDLWTCWQAGSFADAHNELAAWRVGYVGKYMIDPGDHIYIIGAGGEVLYHGLQPGKPVAHDVLDASEFATQQGMAFGIDAYNEAYGC